MQLTNETGTDSFLCRDDGHVSVSDDYCARLNKKSRYGRKLGLVSFYPSNVSTKFNKNLVQGQFSTVETC